MNEQKDFTYYYNCVHKYEFVTSILKRLEQKSTIFKMLLDDYKKDHNIDVNDKKFEERIKEYSNDDMLNKELMSIKSNIDQLIKYLDYPLRLW